MLTQSLQLVLTVKLHVSLATDLCCYKQNGMDLSIQNLETKVTIFIFLIILLLFN